MRGFEIAPGARLEILEIGAHYALEREELREDFGAAIDDAIARIVRGPEAWPLVEELGPEAAVRRIRLSGFPYRAAYLVTPSLVRVLSVEHVARGEPAWRDRLPPSP